MGKTLIITEKPSVARDYAQILKVSGKGDGLIENDNYIISWCVGHLIEMVYPESYDMRYKKWNLRDLPFLPEKYKYDVIGKTKKQYAIVHSLLHRKDVDIVLWAGDSGREGQVIEELIRMYGGVRKGIEEKRIWIDSTTEEEVSRGIREAKPYSAYENLSNAGIMRGIEDYAMGINFSRALSVKYGSFLNNAAKTKKYAAVAVGRVMTCVLGMVVRREKEIRAFKETIFYRIIGHFATDGGSYEGEWKAVEGSLYFASPKIYNDRGFLKKEDAESFIEDLMRPQENKKEPEAYVQSVKKSTEKKRPPLLFNLAELQAACTKAFKISPDETLKAAQELYEGKLITYPRTDARVLSSGAAKEIEKNLKGLSHFPEAAPFVKEIMERGTAVIKKKPYTDDSKVTDHYAIIPTGNLSRYGSMSPLCHRIYDLIMRRFLAAFYSPAVYQKLAVETILNNEHFFSSSKVLTDPGYLVVTGQDKKEGEEGQELPASLLGLKKGAVVKVEGLELKEGKTSPPKRYTSGSMILAMENAGQLIEDEELRAQIKGAGIGTSATRAGIIEKLIKIGYLALEKKSQVLTPKKFGEMVYELVNLTMPGMLNPEMTASWEKGLSGVERGEISAAEYKLKLDSYVSRYVEKVKGADLTQELSKRIAGIA